ncbi:ComF family protein [Alginatibacterium sediminis]|uniref:ComF family protein n=1 Tax=Alginatibacterium sediminis TaxID=2164068 RepID=A0A420ELJ6_9ALTE|nr:ComF family protein [Alginatibacterium sediminis]RKF21476.1 ComF family protein [Alginatibacterium sediminis]
MGPKIQKILASLVMCPVCMQPLGETEHACCQWCWQRLQLPQKTRCPQCAIEVTFDGLCGECLSQPPYFDYSYCLSDFDWPYAALIKKFKYQKQRSLAKLFAQQMWLQFSDYSYDVEQFVFVPMHWWKKHRRGFNQSQALCQYLSQFSQIPTDALFKSTFQTKSLAQLNAKQRQIALIKRFSLRAKPKLKHIVLIDDVMTTGATLNCLSKQLKAAGVQRVGVWLIARTAKPNKTGT